MTNEYSTRRISICKCNAHRIRKQGAAHPSYHMGLILAVIIVALLGPIATEVRGQSYLQNIGIPTFSQIVPVENGYINLSTGDLHLEIPLGSFPQRGGRQLVLVQPEMES
jgi:hypothetical protein